MNRDILEVLVWSALAQVAGFGKAVLITYYFGVGALLDGYYLAQAVPAMVAGVLAGFMQTGFLPLYSAHLARGEREDAQAMLGSALALATGVGLAISAVITVVAPALVMALVGADGAAIREPAVAALQVLSFVLLFNAVVDCIGLALNAHHRFAAAAGAPIVNALVSGAILAAAPDWGLANLIAGTLVGILLQLMVVLFAARRADIHLARGRSGQIPKILRGGAAVLPGLLLSNVATFVPPAFAVRIGEGAVTALSLAGRIHGALTQVFAMALSTVLLSHFAQAIARNETAQIAKSLREGFPTVRALGIVVALWVALAGTGIIAMVFERGAFDSAATSAVAGAWLWMSVGLVPVVWGIALAKVLQAMQLGALLSRISALSLVVLATVCAAGAALNSLAVIAYGTVLAYGATAVALASAVNYRISLNGGDGPRLPSGLAIFAVLSVAGLVLAYAVQEPTSTAATVLVTIAALTAGIGIARNYASRRR